MLESSYDNKYYNLGVRHAIFAPLSGNSICMQEGVAWRHSRGILLRQADKTQYKKLDQYQQHIEDLISHFTGGR